VFAELPRGVELDQKDVAPTEILERRMVKKGNHSIPQVLIRWTNLPEDATTWEDYYVVKQRFPEALAWGHASSEAGGDVSTECPNRWCRTRVLKKKGFRRLS
jgi:hypothetical protein